MKRLIPSLALALALCVASSAHADRIWMFGDSLSDNGNLSLLFATDGNDDTYLPPEAYVPYFPPELGGAIPLQRIPNGKIVAEYVSEFFGEALLPSGLASHIGGEAANNFAIFGARASLTSQLDLPYQVAQLAGRAAAGMDLRQDRAVVFIGANDVFAAWGAAIAPLATGGEIDMDAGEAVVDAAIDSLAAYLMGDGGVVQLADGSLQPVPSLVQLGIAKFVIMNLPDISTTPWVNQTAEQFGGNKDVVKAAKKLTRRFNKQLKRLVRKLERGHGGYEVIRIDIGKISKKVRKKARKLGFANKNDDCYLTNTLATLTDGIPPTPGEFRDSCGPDVIDEFMFLDTAHPTGAVHSEIADRVLRKLYRVH